MNRSMCGGFLLAGMIVLGGCSGDPTGDLVGTGATLSPTPSSLFLGQGQEEAIVVNVVDAQGNQQDLTGFSFQAGAGVTVTEDTTFLSTSAGQLGTSRRLFVRGDAATATSVSITANSLTSNVPVKVTPIGTTVTLSNAAPAANEGLVITLPAGYKFGSGGGASVAGALGITTAVAPDSTSATVLLPPGVTGPVTVDSVAVDFVPGVLFSLPTTEVVTVGAVTPLAGTGSPASAPAVTIQPPGGSTVFFDGGTFDYAAPILGGAFGSFPARLYNITVADTTTLTTTIDWPSPEDLGIYFFLANGTTETGSPADAGGGGEHPESATNVLAPGSYRMAVVNFNPTNPAYFALTITTEVPETDQPQ
jgi:hypothetical protein